MVRVLEHLKTLDEMLKLLLQVASEHTSMFAAQLFQMVQNRLRAVLRKGEEILKQSKYKALKLLQVLVS